MAPVPLWSDSDCSPAAPVKTHLPDPLLVYFNFLLISSSSNVFFGISAITNVQRLIN